MKAIHRRIVRLESRHTKMGEAAEALIQIVLRSVERLPRMTCRRVRGAGGMIFETINFHGMDLAAVPADSPEAVEAAEFLAWVGTVPTDGVEREFAGAGGLKLTGGRI